jgi:hypothetical protein
MRNSTNNHIISWSVSLGVMISDDTVVDDVDRLSNRLFVVAQSRKRAVSFEHAVLKLSITHRQGPQLHGCFRIFLFLVKIGVFAGVLNQNLSFELKRLSFFFLFSVYHEVFLLLFNV